MKPANAISIVAMVAMGTMFLWPQSGGGDPVAQLPEFAIKDQNGAVLGGYSGSSSTGTITVAMTDTINNERFQISVGVNFLRGADTNDVFYTDANCTGIPYVFAPTVLPTNMAGLRGSTYAVGADDSGMLDTRIVRGTTTNLGDNDAILNSRFRTNTFSGPDCSAVDPGVNTVQAEVILDLSTFVRPFVAE